MHDHSSHKSTQQTGAESCHDSKSQQDGNMGQRGVTRPSHQMQDMLVKMTQDDRMKMLHMHHMQTLWVYWALIILGVWLILSPVTFSYAKGLVEPSGGRSVWLSLGKRISFLKWSDVVSGVILVFFGWRSLLPNRPISLWICCFVGIWLNMAPLVFWAPAAVTYMNDTLVGMLVICLSILIPGMPNMMMYMKMGSDMPQGWSYNPSSWPQRWIMILMGFLGFIVSRYLAAFQLGYTDHIWDPLFGEGSKMVLNSTMSHSLPVSDAGLGTLAYTFEFLMGFMGSPKRWRTMPWMVALFGILVIPLGLVHIFLVISQPLVVGEWCFFCLAAAAIMLPMIPLEIDEVVAMGQHMVQATRRGEKFWSVFWKGGNPVDENNDERSPELMQLNTKFDTVFKSSIWGMSAPVTLIISALLGIGLVIFPGQAGIATRDNFADINHLCGSLVVVAAVISMGEVVRSLRFINVLLGFVVAFLPFVMTDVSITLKIVDLVAGLAIAGLALPKGKVKEQYGLWNKYIK